MGVDLLWHRIQFAFTITFHFGLVATALVGNYPFWLLPSEKAKP